MLFWLKAERFQQFDRKWSASLPKPLRCLRRNYLRKVSFCWNFCCVKFSFWFWVNFLALLAGKFGRFIRTVFLRVRCTLQRLSFKKTVFFEKYWNWAETLQIFGNKQWPVLSKKSKSLFKTNRREKSAWENHKIFFHFEQ